MYNELELPDQIKIAEVMANEAACKLIEYCDSVKIFCTAPCPNGGQATYSFNVTRGNSYAAIGQILIWIEREKRSG